MDHIKTGWKKNLDKYRKVDEKRMYSLHKKRSRMSMAMGVMKSIVAGIDRDIEKIRGKYEL